MVGPLGLYKVDEFASRPPAAYRSSDGGRHFTAHAFYAILKANASATIKVAAQSKGELTILTDPARGGGDPDYQLTDGDQRLGLKACQGEDTQFLEAFVVAGAQCGHFRISVAGSKPKAVEVPFGKGRCN